MLLIPSLFCLACVVLCKSECIRLGVRCSSRLVVVAVVVAQLLSFLSTKTCQHVRVCVYMCVGVWGRWGGVSCVRVCAVAHAVFSCHLYACAQKSRKIEGLFSKNEIKLPSLSHNRLDFTYYVPHARRFSLSSRFPSSLTLNHHV